MSAIDIVKTFSPDVLGAYFGMINVLENRCSLDGKTKELVLLGILTGKQSEHGITVHVKRAQEQGATVEEILTVIISALPSCGMGAVIKAIDQAKEVMDIQSIEKRITK